MVRHADTGMTVVKEEVLTVSPEVEGTTCHRGPRGGNTSVRHESEGATLLWGL